MAKEKIEVGIIKHRAGNYTFICGNCSTKERFPALVSLKNIYEIARNKGWNWGKTYKWLCPECAKDKSILFA